MARNPNPPPGGPWEYHEHRGPNMPLRPLLVPDRRVGRLVSRRQPPEGMHICPITGKWRHNPPPRIRKAALMRSVCGCALATTGSVTWGITGIEWAILTIIAGCSLMSWTVVVDVLGWSLEAFLRTIRVGLEHDRHIRAIRDGVYRGPSDDLREFAYRGPAESRPMQPPPPPPSSEPSEVIRTMSGYFSRRISAPPKIHRGQMIDPRPEGSMMLPPVVVLGVDVPTHDDVVEAMKAINEGGDLFEVWIVSDTKLSFDEWMDATIPETEE